MVAVEAVIMGVGRLLHGGIVPLARIGIVRPAGHVRQQVVAVRRAAEQPVHHGERLGAGDAPLRAERP